MEKKFADKEVERLARRQFKMMQQGWNYFHKVLKPVASPELIEKHSKMLEHMEKAIQAYES